jgi:DNA polymerase-3 subunit epsilon
VQFEAGKEVRSEAFLVDPRCYFDPMNVSIHSIDGAAIRGGATFSELHERLHGWTADQVVVCHTHFDRVSFSRACAASRLPELACRWLDSAKVTRRTWAQFSARGYGLSSVADFLGIAFQHHDALHDARTAGLILLKAMETTGRDLEAWLARVRQGISGSGPAVRVGDGDGPLLGQTIVFTGALGMARREAADCAAAAGADVEAGVTKRTTMLVVGDQDISKLNGHQRSSKHIKAEMVAAAGQPIRIVGESDFMALIASDAA